MALVSRILGLQLTVFLVVWLLASAGVLENFIDLPSLIAVFGVASGIMLICYTPSDLLAALRALVSAAMNQPDAGCREAEAVLGRAYQAVWGMGLIATLLNFITMLWDLSDPSAIGAGMAVSLLAVAYAAFAAELLIAPCRQLLLNQTRSSTNDDHRAESDQKDTRPIMGLYRGILVVLVMIGTFVISILSFSTIISYTESIDTISESVLDATIYEDERLPFLKPEPLE